MFSVLLLLTYNVASRVTPIIQDLNKRGFNVQLRHVDTETTWEAHGYVKLLSKNGEVLAENAMFQHNRSRIEVSELTNKLPAVDSEVYA